MEDVDVTVAVEKDVIDKAVESALKKVLKEGCIGSMSPESFAGMVYELLQDRRMMAAKNEAIASAKIFSDVEGFKSAVTNPFRIVTVDQLKTLCNNMAEAIVPGQTQLVIAVAVVETEKVRPFGG